MIEGYERVVPGSAEKIVDAHVANEHARAGALTRLTRAESFGVIVGTLGAQLLAIGGLAAGVVLIVQGFPAESLLGFVPAVIGSGALVGALPAAAAAAAPRGQTGVASGLTNTTKTIGGSFASALFGVVLLAGAASAVTSTAASLAGYMVVWAVCGLGALAAAVLLFFVPKLAFADADVVIEAEPEASGAPALP